MNEFDQSREVAFLPARIELCPECNSKKIVFSKSRGRKRKNDPMESTGAVRAAAAEVSRAVA